MSRMKQKIPILKETSLPFPQARKEKCHRKSQNILGQDEDRLDDWEGTETNGAKPGSFANPFSPSGMDDDDFHWPPVEFLSVWPHHFSSYEMCKCILEFL